jgi:hypothetical protein
MKLLKVRQRGNVKRFSAKNATQNKAHARYEAAKNKLQFAPIFAKKSLE